MTQDAAIVNMSLTYNQLLGLAMQLPATQRQRLCEQLSGTKRPMDDLRKIHDRNAEILDSSISMDDIVAECKIVRQEMYDARRAK